MGLPMSRTPCGSGCLSQSGDGGCLGGDSFKRRGLGWRLCRERTVLPADCGFLGSSQSCATFMTFTMSQCHLYYYFPKTVL